MAVATITDWSKCSLCDISEENGRLYACMKENCVEFGRIYCIDCGESLHKSKDHPFDDGEDYIKSNAEPRQKWRGPFEVK